MKEEIKEKLQRVLDRAVEEKELAGGSVLVLKGGQEVCYAESGMADREEKRPVARDTIYRLYSMSKPITAAAVMKLVEDGLLDLAEPVSTFFPSFQKQMVEKDGRLVESCREVTVQHLLHMTGGLVYGGRGGLTGEYMDQLFEEMDRRLLGESPMSTAEFGDLLG